MQEFIAPDGRHIRHPHRFNKQGGGRKKPGKKKQPKQSQGQKNQKVPTTTPRHNKHNKKQQLLQKFQPGITILTEEALEQERVRAFELEEEKARLRKEQRELEFGGEEDYWNDDNTIGSDSEVEKWGVRSSGKRLTVEKTKNKEGKGKPGSILINHLMGKGSGTRRHKLKDSNQSKALAASGQLDEEVVVANSRQRSSITTGSKKRASEPHNRLNNHHHHPSLLRGRGS